MFKDLRAATKFLILCGVFVLLTSVATYALLVEKQIAINFAHSELVGSKYLALLRPLYAAVLKTYENGGFGDRQDASELESIDSLANADAETAGNLHIESFVNSLATTLHDLNASSTASIPPGAIYFTALKKLRELAARIGDDSNITLDPVLDAYHVGDIVVTRLPTALEELGQAQLLTQESKAPIDAAERKARFIALETLLRANIDSIMNDLSVAQRGRPDSKLKQLVEPAVTAFAVNANAYIDSLRGLVDANAKGVGQSGVSSGAAVSGALDAWRITQKQLDQLLVYRIDELGRQRLLSIILIGALGTLGLFVALLTYRDMIVPIKRLAGLANSIRETKNYGLRFDYESKDEIGRLGNAFNEMLRELAAARDREIMSQSEIARVSRLATMGAMVASITHEIKQPLAALVANSYAGLRWLAKEKPDLDEVRTVLERAVEEGHRASDVIASVGAIFKKDTSRRVPVNMSHVVNDVLKLCRGELRTRKIILNTNLESDLPRVFADPIQLQEVLLNLIMNAAEAMGTTAENGRILKIVSMLRVEGVMVAVEDSGIGLDAGCEEKIFEAFYTTKPTGMGMGLSICRSIVEAHNGRLWASPGISGGSVFYVVLPLNVGESRAAGARL